MRKTYIHDMEVIVTVQDLPEKHNLIRYCEAPNYQMVPGCLKAFYSCEYEKTYGTQKHVPGMSWYNRPKPGTMITCKDMPLDLCQNLVNKKKLYCPFCNHKLAYKENK